MPRRGGGRGSGLPQFYLRNNDFIVCIRKGLEIAAQGLHFRISAGRRSSSVLAIVHTISGLEERQSLGMQRVEFTLHSGALVKRRLDRGAIRLRKRAAVTSCEIIKPLLDARPVAGKALVLGRDNHGPDLLAHTSGRPHHRPMRTRRGPGLFAQSSQLGGADDQGREVEAVHIVRSRVSRPWAIVVPVGNSRTARSTSTWIHCLQPVACANCSIRSWVTSIQ